MATTTAMRPDDTGPTVIPLSALLSRELAGFRAGRGPEDRLVDLVAFALAAERDVRATPDSLPALRQDALRELSEHAFRYLHNSVEQIRREAVAEQMAMFRRPLGFGAVLLANLLALLLFAVAAGWLALHPATLAALAGAFAG
ncbi:hypothetical protein [Roseicella aquatilis]|uniref:Uncharacterized protein n=1 Tax=Roseicella aquatilis TaxID=2527868 RepID=A0A4R4DBG3_9PROT|nr:hypothetical protein [Roseicella aquatilis]TCZ57955.1 hypothetical protein EXY23_17375 [Roseicella aquatilis]